MTSTEVITETQQHTREPSPEESIALHDLKGSVSNAPTVPPSESGQSRADAASFASTSASAGASEGENATPLAQVDYGWQAYSFLAASVVFEMIIWGGAYSFGTFESYFANNPQSKLYGKASSSATSAIGTLMIAGLHFVPLLFRGYFRSYPHHIKTTCQVSLALSSLSLLVASFFESNVVVLLVFQGILYGITSGLCFTAVILWLPQWFNKRRGMASGVIYSGSGLGGTIFPVIFGKLLSSIGFSWTLRAIAAFNLISISIAAYFLKPRLPIVRPSTNYAPRALIKALAPDGLRAMIGPFSFTLQALIFFQGSAWLSISLYLASYTSTLGFSQTTATATLSAFNASATLGYLLLGRLIDSTSYTKLMAISTSICSLSAFLLLGFSRSLPLLIIFSLIFGTAGGGFTTFITPISNDLALIHNQQTAPIYLAFIFVRGISAVIGPLIGSSLYNVDESDFSIYGTKGFRGLVVYVGCGMAAASILSGVAHWLRRKQLGATTIRVD
ncbi:unnamed protein product [Sympodiomycopsis kandeliae]